MASKKNHMHSSTSLKRLVDQYINDRFKIWFRVEKQFIDLRAMSLNYTNGEIPLDDISKLHQLVNNIEITDPPYDPELEGIVQFAWVTWAELYLNPVFQRDSSPNQHLKIKNDFEHTSVIVPCALKLDGKYFIWDGHHTLQTLKTKNYTKYPIWFIDGDQISDEDAYEKGFPDKIKYLIWLAGTNMKRINLQNKLKLSNYDAYMISVDIEDPKFVAMDRILHNAGFEAKRKATGYAKSKYLPFTQVNSGMEIYEILDSNQMPGTYLKRSLEFHKQTWPNSAAVLEIWRPVARICANADIQGLTLDQQFFIDLGNELKSLYGDPDTAQERLKTSLQDAIKNHQFNGAPQDHDQWRMHDAIINLYNQRVGKIVLPTAQCQWKVI